MVVTGVIIVTGFVGGGSGMNRGICSGSTTAE